MRWILMGGLSEEFLFFKNEFLGLNYWDKENDS